jgi:hypothetical protein
LPKGDAKGCRLPDKVTPSIEVAMSQGLAVIEKTLAGPR